MNLFRLLNRLWSRSSTVGRFFGAGFGLAAVLFILQAAKGETRPGGVWGLVFGWGAALLMFAAAAYAWRRRSLAWVSSRGWGTARSWLSFHLGAGLLAFVLVLFHIAFRLPQGGLDWLLFLLTVWVTLTGLCGVAIQKSIPRMLTEGLRIEVLYGRIPALVREIRREADDLSSRCGEVVQSFYRASVAPLLERPRLRWRVLLASQAGSPRLAGEFTHLSRVVAEGERPRVTRLRQLHEAKAELDAHFTLQRILRGWLILHAPPSFALLVLLVWHMFAAWYY